MALIESNNYALVSEAVIEMRHARIGRGLILIGEQGIGKSTLLRQIQSDYRNHTFVRYFPGLEELERQEVLISVFDDLDQFSGERILLFDEYDDCNSLRFISENYRDRDVVLIATNIENIYKRMDAYYMAIRLRKAGVSEIIAYLKSNLVSEGGEDLVDVVAEALLEVSAGKYREMQGVLDRLRADYIDV